MNDLISQVLEMSPPVGLAVALLLLGIFLKRSPVPNWVIPMILMGGGGVAYPFIADLSKVSFSMRNPHVFNIIIGVCIGGLSIGMHAQFKHLIERFLPKGGDTAFFTKPKTEIEPSKETKP